MTRPRGLCYRCFYAPGVKSLYEPDGSAGEDGARGHEREPSMEEVERMIAEQMRPENLPAWWPIIGPDLDPEGD